MSHVSLGSNDMSMQYNTTKREITALAVMGRAYTKQNMRHNLYICFSGHENSSDSEAIVSCSSQNAEDLALRVRDIDFQNEKGTWGKEEDRMSEFSIVISICSLAEGSLLVTATVPVRCCTDTVLLRRCKSLFRLCHATPCVILSLSPLGIRAGIERRE
nr:hypothetical protein CFP56_42169 [Quercus suber]